MAAEAVFGDRILYERIGGGIRLIRLYGETGEALVPAEVDALTVKEIGAYCFSEKKPEGVEEKIAEGITAKRPLSGDFVETVVLPDTVTALGAYAFYGCRRLTTLTFGKDLTDIQNDAFMNCRSLKRLIVHAAPAERTGLKRILSQLKEEVSVVFEENGEVLAELLYPGFSETYEEISPAHIFGLHIEGEGKRAREQFAADVVDYSGYDRIFPKSMCEESDLTLLRMAACRLRWPVGLTESAKEMYLSFFREKEAVVLRELIDRRRAGELGFLLRNGILSGEARREAIRRSSALGWTEGNLLLIRGG